MNQIPEETEIPEGAEVTITFLDGSGCRAFFIRGPRGDGDAFVVRNPETRKVWYVKNFELMVQK